MNKSYTGNAEIKINTSPSAVWKALTDPQLIKQYFFGTNARSDFKEGSPIRFTGEWEGKTYEDKGTILKSKENKLLVYDYWSSMSGIDDKPENYVTLTFELIPESDSTVLKITQENIRDEKTRDHSIQNWNMVLQNMKELLEKK